MIKRISGGKRKGEKLVAGSNSSEQGILHILFGWVYRPLGKNFRWVRWLYHSQVRQFGWGNKFFFFWISITKHHKITMHCTLIHEPFFSFSTNENISLHWNMNGNLKLVSWITHLQPFFSQLHLLIKSRGSEREVLLFQCWHSPSLHVWTWCCYHLGTPRIQEGKNTKTESPKLIWLVLLNYIKLWNNTKVYLKKNNVLYFPHQGKVWWPELYLM